jgi:hypothetical protein
MSDLEPWTLLGWMLVGAIAGSVIAVVLRGAAHGLDQGLLRLHQTLGPTLFALVFVGVLAAIGFVINWRIGLLVVLALLGAGFFALSRRPAPPADSL